MDLDAIPLALRYLWPFLLLPIPLILWLVYRTAAGSAGANEPPPSKDELDPQIKRGQPPGVARNVVREQELNARAGMWRRIAYQWLIFSVLWLPLWFILSLGVNLGGGTGLIVSFLAVAFFLFIVYQFYTIAR